MPAFEAVEAAEADLGGEVVGEGEFDSGGVAGFEDGPAGFGEVDHGAEAVHLAGLDQPGGGERVEDQRDLLASEPDEDAERAELREPEPNHLLGARADEHLRDRRLAEPPLGAGDPRKCLHHHLASGRGGDRPDRGGGLSGAGPLAVVAAPALGGLEVAEIIEDISTPAFRSLGVAGHPGELLVLLVLALGERSEVDLDLAGALGAVEDADGVAPEWRDVVDRELGVADQGAERPRERDPVEPDRGREFIGMEIDRFVEPAIHEPLDRQEDEPLGVGLRAEAVGKTLGLGGFLRADADDRHVLAGAEPLDAPGRLQEFQRRPDGRLVEVEPDRRLDLVLGQFDGVGVLLAQELVDLVHRVGRGIFIINEHFLELAVAEGVEQHAVGGLAVAAGAAGLLVVGFDRPRHVEVDDRADVGLVHSHPEGVGGDDHVGTPSHELILGRLACVAVEPGVIDDRRPPEPGHVAADVLAALPARRIDDRRAGVPAEDLGEGVELLGVAAGLDHAIGQVRAIEPRDELGGVAKVELVGDVAADEVGGGGRQGDAGGHLQLSAGAAEPGVVGAEVVAPLADAMGLVHREQRRPDPPHRLHEPAGAEPLGGDVHEVISPGLDVDQASPQLRRVDRAIEECRPEATLGERVHLIFHQRDQGGDDERDAFQEERGQLIAKALAAAGRHHAEDVPAVEDGLDHGSLTLAEGVEAEALVEGSLQGVALGSLDFHARPRLPHRLVPPPISDRPRSGSVSDGLHYKGVRAPPRVGEGTGWTRSAKPPKSACSSESLKSSRLDGRRSPGVAGTSSRSRVLSRWMSSASGCTGPARPGSTRWPRTSSSGIAAVVASATSRANNTARSPRPVPGGS